jgi:hypothetical protein
VIVGFILGVLITFGGAVSGCKWKADRFEGIGATVRIRANENHPLYMCADTINGAMKNCVPEKQVIEYARDYWVQRGKVKAEK